MLYEEWATAYQKKKAERQREMRRAKDQKRYAHWRQANPDKIRDRNHRYRASRAGADGDHSEAEWQLLLGLYEHRCAYCAEQATTKDHLVPISRGGSNGIENIVPACLSCNSSKGTHLLWEWSGRPAIPLKIF